MYHPERNERGLIGALAIAALCVLLIFWMLADGYMKTRPQQPQFQPAHMERTAANS